MSSALLYREKIVSLITQSRVIEDGTPTRYSLKPRTDSHDQSEPYRKMIFGERDQKKQHKTILMVGETGTGKTKLINAIINYVLGVQRNDKVWFEITDDQSDQTSAHSQTSIITVYGFYLQESPIDLTIIDTPGYGDTRAVDKDKEIAMSLLSLSRFDDWVHKIDAVCLVIMAQQNRLCNRQQYIFDAVQSLFGRDIAENIVLLFTHSRGAHPKNALAAVKEAKIKCAVNDKNQPVYFLFDNCQGETFDDEYQMVQKQSWNLSFKEMAGFFKFLDNIKPKTLMMTQDVLQKHKQLETSISNLKSHVQMMEKRQNMLKESQKSLKQNMEYIKNIKNFEYEVEVSYKEKVDINPALASMAMCCTVCEENCHYPGCWWVSDLSWCSMMKNYHCTVCTKKCHYSKHVKGATIYIMKKKKVKKTNDVSKKSYDVKIRDGESMVKKLEEEMQQLETKKVKLVMEAFYCVEALQLIALNIDSVLILLHIDYLIEKVKEINEPDYVKILENIKKRAGQEKKGALGYIAEDLQRIQINE